MRLKVISTGSVGNAYLLYNEQDALLIECGVKIKDIAQAIDFDFNKLAGCIVTHDHNDHSKSMMDLIRKGVDLYATVGTHKAVGTVNEKRAKTFKAMDNFTVGNFKILAFDVKHDAAEPVGFLIYHPECGKVLFLTDCNYCKYVFPGLNNIIIEANFSKKIIDQKFGKDSKNEFLRNRILRNHFSIEHCEDMLKKHDLKDVIEIVLIHLSDSNSNEIEFKETIEKATYKHVTVAQKGTDINFNKLPF